MDQTSLSTANINELSVTTKVQRDEWIKAFWQYLDGNTDTGEILRRWQKAGCDPRNIAISVHRYVIGYLSKLDADRQKHKKRTKGIFMAAVLSLRDLGDLYRFYGRFDAADRITTEARLVQDELSRIDSAFSTKRLGSSRSWTDLVMIEGFVFEATNQQTRFKRDPGSKLRAWGDTPDHTRRKRKQEYDGTTPLECPELEAVAEFLVTPKPIREVKTFTALAKNFGVSRMTVYRWTKDEDVLKRAAHLVTQNPVEGRSRRTAPLGPDCHGSSEGRDERRHQGCRVLREARMACEPFSLKSNNHRISQLANGQISPEHKFRVAEDMPRMSRARRASRVLCVASSSEIARNQS
jgi:hypothetical protein